MTVVIILINFPWYAVCVLHCYRHYSSDHNEKRTGNSLPDNARPETFFASSMGNLAVLFGVAVPDFTPLVLRLLCVAAGTAVAYKGVGAITHTTRILGKEPQA